MTPESTSPCGGESCCCVDLHHNVPPLLALGERLRRAISHLEELAICNTGTTRDRIVAKAEGVRLALSYIEDAAA